MPTVSFSWHVNVATSYGPPLIWRLRQSCRRCDGGNTTLTPLTGRNWRRWSDSLGGFSQGVFRSMMERLASLVSAYLKMPEFFSAANIQERNSGKPIQLIPRSRRIPARPIQSTFNSERNVLQDSWIERAVAHSATFRGETWLSQQSATSTSHIDNTKLTNFWACSSNSWILDLDMQSPQRWEQPRRTSLSLSTQTVHPAANDLALSLMTGKEESSYPTESPPYVEIKTSTSVVYPYTSIAHGWLSCLNTLNTTSIIKLNMLNCSLLWNNLKWIFIFS